MTEEDIGELGRKVSETKKSLTQLEQEIQVKQKYLSELKKEYQGLLFQLTRVVQKETGATISPVATGNGEDKSRHPVVNFGEQVARMKGPDGTYHLVGRYETLWAYSHTQFTSAEYADWTTSKGLVRSSAFTRLRYGLGLYLVTKGWNRETGRNSTGGGKMTTYIRLPNGRSLDLTATTPEEKERWPQEQRTNEGVLQ